LEIKSFYLIFAKKILHLITDHFKIYDPEGQKINKKIVKNGKEEK